ncbi:protein FAM43A, partial [Hyalella azteca]|uniref:Protein FAM43A n=1 Tax=Hyalella azteca TaxID=294128 RepID=A0A8B7NIT4_HYAAZ
MPNLSLRKLWRKRTATISQKDPTYKVIYLGNVLTGWAKVSPLLQVTICSSGLQAVTREHGLSNVSPSLSPLLQVTICSSGLQAVTREHGLSNVSPSLSPLLQVTICSSGLQAVTREHGLTEYWAHRVTYCTAHPAYPKVFCWVYRHEGRRLKQELRCHAVLCYRNDKAQVMASQLKERLSSALYEFRREKVIRQNARLSLMHAIYDNAALPSRKVMASQLKERLSSALYEFRREKVIRQNARLSLMHAIYDNAALPSRK